MKINKLTFWFVLVAVLLITWTALFGLAGIPGANKMRFGIDIRGGVDAVFEPVDLGRMNSFSQNTAWQAMFASVFSQKAFQDRNTFVFRMFVTIRCRVRDPQYRAFSPNPSRFMVLTV